MDQEQLLKATRKARELKEDLEEDIVDLLNRFSDETGLRIGEIDLGEVTSFGKGISRYWVKVDARL
jgi:hypothetical protein